MPLPTQHAARQMEPSPCDRFRRVNDAFGKGIDGIYCVKNNKAEPQSTRVDADKFTPAEAKDWLKKHDFSAADFEEATGEGKAAARAVDLAAEHLPPALRLDTGQGVLELQAAAGDGTNRKRAFTATAYTGAAMRLDGFGHPVVVDLAGLAVPTKRFPTLRQHDPERIVGYTDEATTSAQRLRVSGHLTAATDAGREALTLADEGFPWQVSLGADVGKMEFVDKGVTAKVNGRNFDGPCYVARATSLRECSLVPLGADVGTSATVG